MRIGAFGVLVAAVTFAVIRFLSPLIQPKESGVSETASAIVVDIQAAMDGFDIKEIRARVGDTITVNLHSYDSERHIGGSITHQFAIDELGVNIIASEQSTGTGTFTVTKAGTYTFYCSTCCGGRANPAMNGKLLVKG